MDSFVTLLKPASSLTRVPGWNIDGHARVSWTWNHLSSPRRFDQSKPVVQMTESELVNSLTPLLFYLLLIFLSYRLIFTSHWKPLFFIYSSSINGTTTSSNFKRTNSVDTMRKERTVLEVQVNGKNRGSLTNLPIEVKILPEKGETRLWSFGAWPRRLQLTTTRVMSTWWREMPPDFA